MTKLDPGINNQRSYWPHGKVAGGSSSINDWRDLGNWLGLVRRVALFKKSET